MSDLINREDLIRVICLMDCDVDRTKDDICKRVYCDEVKRIKEFPSAEPERKTGKWEDKEVFDGEGYISEWQSCRCSKCDRYLTTPYMYSFISYNFCPNCGAKMEVEE